jgi:scyllo-inosamine-4-phosphate amidinotransferase 1
MLYIMVTQGYQMLNSKNEWGKLKEVVVGTTTNANWPSNDPVFANEGKKTLWKESPVPSGPVPQRIIEESNEDLQALADTLSKLGVIVHRPTFFDYQNVGGMYGYCPRDRLIVAGEDVVDVSMMYPCRNQEIITLSEVTRRARTVHTMPKYAEYILDAANICRLGDTWLYLISDGGNKQSLLWLRERFPDITIEECNFYAGVHIDSTITPLREGLVIINGTRVNEDTCPKAFKDWEKIYITDVVAQDFYQYPYASRWIALNMLSVDPNTVILDKKQTALIDMLEKKGITCIPLELRHSRTLGGGFHCVTLDLVRE